MPEVMQLTKEQVGEQVRQCLREVDSFIKSQNLTGAKLKLAEARELDSSNPYLGAFEARINTLESTPASSPSQPSNTPPPSREFFTRTPNPFAGNIISTNPKPSLTDKLKQQVESEAKFQVAANWRTMESTMVGGIEDVSVRGVKSTKELGSELLKKYHQQIALDRKKLEEEATLLLDIERKRLQEEFGSMVNKQNDQARTIRKQVRKEMEQNFLHLLEQISKQYERKLELLDIHIPETKTDTVAMYKKKMRTYYSTGSPSEDNAKKLMELKELLELTFDEHLQIESDVREEMYTFTLRKKILLGEITFNSYSKIEELRQQYRLSKEQASRSESLIFSRIKKFDIKGHILLVDPDAMHREVVINGLTERNYDVLAVSNVQEALDVLNKEFVDLIISGVKFPDGEMEGFRFFSLVQEQFALRRIPFLVLTSITDSMVYRCGAQLGVDDILFKPMDIDLLNSVIEGKLKRYRELAQV